MEWINKVLSYYHYDISDKEFEKYVNESKDFENFIEPDDYLELISKNYEKNNYRHELRNILEKYVSDATVETFYIKTLLKNFVEGKGDPAEIIDDLYGLLEKHPYIYALAIQSVNGVDDLPKLSQK